MRRRKRGLGNWGGGDWVRNMGREGRERKETSLIFLAAITEKN